MPYDRAALVLSLPVVKGMIPIIYELTANEMGDRKVRTTVRWSPNQ
jgi:hypothetical protein